MARITAKDLVAFMVIVALVIFKLTGHNGSLDMAMAVIVGYYFARREDAQIRIPPALIHSKGDVELRVTTNKSNSPNTTQL